MEENSEAEGSLGYKTKTKERGRGKERGELGERERLGERGFSKWWLLSSLQ